MADAVLLAAGTGALTLSFLCVRSLLRLASSDLAATVDLAAYRLLPPVAALLLASSALLLGALALPAPVRANLALATVATAVGLYAGEATLLEAPRDAREVIGTLRGRGIRAYPFLSPFFFLRSPMVISGTPISPLAGIARVTTVSCREAGDWLIYRSDEHGFPNPPGLWEAPTLDVLALGDSFTAGACVPPRESAVALVRRVYPATLNLASPGNGPLLMLAGLREYLPHLRPTVVLWVYFAGNDLRDLHFERQSDVLRHYLRDDGFSQGLFGRQEMVDRALAWRAEELLRRPRSGPLARAAQDVLLLRRVRARALTWVEDRMIRLEKLTPTRDSIYFPTTEDEYALFGSILERAKEAVEARGGRLSFVYLPSWSEFGPQEGRRLAAQRRRRVLSLVERLGLPLIDVLPPIAAGGGQALFACRRCHYSSEGYAVMAQTILRALGGDGSPVRRSVTRRDGGRRRSDG